MDHLLPVRGDRTTARRVRRPAALLGALVVVAALIAGCGTVQAFTDLDSALSDAGFSSTSVNVAAGDPVALTVKADSPDGDTLEEAHATAAKIIWETFPRQFDEARITIDGDRRTVTAAQLQEELGDRPAGLDEEGSLTDDVNRLGIGLLIGILLTGIAVVAIVGLVALLVVRSRRRAQGAARPGPPVPWAPPVTGGPAPGPVPPPGGWGTSPAPVHAPPIRETRADVRRRGRPVRGPQPPEEQLPPGWG
ncbi:MAG: hypothetical protein ACR2JF_08400 [Iamia sp.]